MTTSWIAGTLVRYGDMSWFLAGLVLVALASYLALYWAGFCGVLAALRVDAFDEKRIVRFIEAYRGMDHHARNSFQQ
jgi:apolipoprotein N-acyltransferase